MNLKPQDVLVSLKLLSKGGLDCTFAQLGQELGISASEANQAFHRARRAGLIRPMENVPVASAIAELLIHGLKYVFPVQPGRRTRGIPTGFAAPPLTEFFGASKEDPDLPVWPDPEGDYAGLEIKPLCRSAPGAARRDSKLYEWLVLADALRGAGRAREQELAEDIVRKRLGYHAPR
jgi:hypothetical protein